MEDEALLSDVMMLDEGQVVLSISLEAIDQRFVALSHDPAVADAMAAAPTRCCATATRAARPRCLTARRPRT